MIPRKLTMPETSRREVILIYPQDGNKLQYTLHEDRESDRISVFLLEKSTRHIQIIPEKIGHGFPWLSSCDRVRFKNILWRHHALNMASWKIAKNIGSY